jgi:multiple antibiotic resistance protein
LFALGLVLGGGKDDHANEGTDPATFPLAMPLIASPQGIVILITFAAAVKENDTSPLILYVALAITMVINLLTLLFGARILKFIPPAALMVTLKVVGVLLTALAVQLILWGMGDLGLVPPIGTKAH